MTTYEDIATFIRKETEEKEIEEQHQKKIVIEHIINVLEKSFFNKFQGLKDYFYISVAANLIMRVKVISHDKLSVTWFGRTNYTKGQEKYIYINPEKGLINIRDTNYIEELLETHFREFVDESFDQPETKDFLDFLIPFTSLKIKVKEVDRTLLDRVLGRYYIYNNLYFYPKKEYIVNIKTKEETHLSQFIYPGLLVAFIYDQIS